VEIIRVGVRLGLCRKWWRMCSKLRENGKPVPPEFRKLVIVVVLLLPFLLFLDNIIYDVI
jgi:hypothetical protein